MGVHQLAQGLTGRQFCRQHQGRLWLEGLSHRQRCQLAATLLLNRVGAEQARIGQPLPAFHQGGTEPGGSHQRQHDADIAGEFKQQQQGRQRRPGTAGQHRGHAHHGVGGRFGYGQVQAAFAEQLAVAVAKHGAEHQRRGKSAPHKSGGIADARCQ